MMEESSSHLDSSVPFMARDELEDGRSKVNLMARFWPPVACTWKAARYMRGCHCYQEHGIGYSES